MLTGTLLNNSCASDFKFVAADIILNRKEVLTEEVMPMFLLSYKEVKVRSF